MMIGLVPEVNRAFSAKFSLPDPGALPQARGECCALGARQMFLRSPTAFREDQARLHHVNSDLGDAVPILRLTPRVSIGFSQGDDGDGYRTLGQYFSAMPSPLLIRICYRMAVPDNRCTPTACGRAIDRRAAPSRDEFPTLRIS